MIHPHSRAWWAGLLLGLLLGAWCIDHGARSTRNARPPFSVISTQ